MTVWEIAEGGARKQFTCGACAVEHYNADRDSRTPPRETEPHHDVPLINECDHGRAKA